MKEATNLLKQIETQNQRSKRSANNEILAKQHQ